MLEPSEFLTKAIPIGVMAVDTETTGGDIRDGRGYCVGISAAVRDNDTYYHSYFPVAHHEGNVSDETKELLFQVIMSRTIVFHNAKFDLTSMETAGYSGKYMKWYCTLMMAHFLNENEPKGLDYLSKRLLGVYGKEDNQKFKGMWAMNLGHLIPVAEMKFYAGIDTVRTLQLYYRMYPYFVKSGFDGDQVPDV
jgi:DNA polymerase I-like protein with 3'-5' exonuclease and polymerase domains